MADMTFPDAPPPSLAEQAKNDAAFKASTLEAENAALRARIEALENPPPPPEKPAAAKPATEAKPLPGFTKHGSKLIGRHYA